MVNSKQHFALVCRLSTRWRFVFRFVFRFPIYLTRQPVVPVSSVLEHLNSQAAKRCATHGCTCRCALVHVSRISQCSWISPLATHSVSRDLETSR